MLIARLARHLKRLLDAIQTTESMRDELFKVREHRIATRDQLNRLRVRIRVSKDADEIDFS